MEKLSEMKSGFMFIWKVKNFSVCNLRLGNYFLSPVFTSEILDNSEWVLELHPISGENVFLELKCKKVSSPSTYFQIELFFKRSNSSNVIKNIDTRNYLGTYSMVQKRSIIFEQEKLFLPDDILTLGCTIKTIPIKIFKTENVIAHTEILAQKSSVKIPLFVPYSKNKQQYIQLPLNRVTHGCPNFKIILDEYNDSTDALFLIKIEMTKYRFPVLTQCKLSLQDAKGNVRYSKKVLHFFLGKNKVEVGNITIPRNCSKFFYGSNTITLHCEFVITDGSYTSTTESLFCSPLRPSEAKLAQKTVPDCPTKQSFKVEDIPTNNSPRVDGKYTSTKKKQLCSSNVELVQKSVSDCPTKHSFMEKLKKFYNEKRLCDFTIQVDDKKFSVHKAILGTVSPVFCAMFELDMEEREKSLLIIDDIDSNTIQRLIDFAYTEIVADLQWDSAINLFAASDKYEILDLKQKCAEFISSKLNVENVTDAFTIADLHQDKYLKKAAEEFIYSNSDAVLESEKWSIFMEKEMKLANTLMRKICLKLSAKISK